jgi:hypothetical protein
MPEKHREHGLFTLFRKPAKWVGKRESEGHIPVSGKGLRQSDQAFQTPSPGKKYG